MTSSTHDDLCMRQIMNSTEARTMAIGISSNAVLMASFKSDTVCEWNWYTMDFTYPHSQKSIGVRSEDLGGHGNWKWREIILTPNCWHKRSLAEDSTCREEPFCIHTTSDRAYQSLKMQLIDLGEWKTNNFRKNSITKIWPQNNAFSTLFESETVIKIMNIVGFFI